MNITKQEAEKLARRVVDRLGGLPAPPNFAPTMRDIFDAVRVELCPPPKLEWVAVVGEFIWTAGDYWIECRRQDGTFRYGRMGEAEPLGSGFATFAECTAVVQGIVNMKYEAAQKHHEESAK